MGTRYPGRAKELNMTKSINVRISDSQFDRMQKYVARYKMTNSAIIREALTIWFNLNSDRKQEG